MSIITSLTRMWLTRSIHPFTFTDKHTEKLDFADCDNLGLYVHIPFCKSICDFCPYCKVIYDENLCNAYIDNLIKEIHLVGNQSLQKKEVTSLYFGGGTPALAANRIKEIIDAISEHYIITDGIGVELHPDNVTIDVLSVLKRAGVTKISIGIQSFSQIYQNILCRQKVNVTSLSNALKTVSFETVSMDFIFALPGQTFDELKTDIDTAFSIGANHIAIYPFIDFTFTKSNIRTMPKKEKRKLLDDITGYCLDKGYLRTSIWTFSKKSDINYSSMTRENFLGFGCSATSLFMSSFKINTFDVKSYCDCIENGKLPTSLTINFTKRQRMIYWLFWTSYSTKVNCDDFEKFFGVKLKSMYGFELWLAKLLGLVRFNDNTYEMTLKGAFYYHYYENFYTLSYIDKMWGIMRKQPFPNQIKM